MEIKNLDKDLTTILNDKYIVPLYQRNFAWGEEEITQLLQDVYDSFSKNKDGNYYIGSLVVLKRKNGDFEVIDGQQRLTAITLIAKILGMEIAPKLFYDSRPEVEAFFNSFYQTGNTENVTFDHKVGHLVNAVEFIKQAKLNPSDENLTIETLTNNNDFKEYFFEKVILVRVEIPEDTDVAAYFEIMNNRGEQLQKHEIIKAKLIDKIKNENCEHDKEKQAIFAKVWNACSQMDIRIQKLFESEDRKNLFGESYDSFNLDNIMKLSVTSQKDCTIKSIDNILLNMENENNENGNSNSTEIEDIEDEENTKSIIDFSNFLMHIFKLLYNDNHQEKTKSEKNPDGVSIPLNDKNMVNVFDKIKDNIQPMDFIQNLLFYRTIFDRFVVKSNDEENEDIKWILQKPYKYTYEKKNTTSLKFSNSFDNEQDRIVKCLSMLQVTFRTRIYKNWLQGVLSWFKPDKFEIDANDYINFLEKWMFDYYTNLKIEIPKIEEGKEVKPYSSRTNTPHFLFNFIDYLYWVESKEKKNNIANIDSVSDFDFKYRNSIEHHLPQSFKKEEQYKDYDNSIFDCLGNLCLVSKSANSRMNNEDPKGKASETGKYYKNNLSPKQKIIYNLTNANNQWGDVEIKQHYNDVVKLLNYKDEILQKNHCCN